MSLRTERFPRLYAAASLKLSARWLNEWYDDGFPRLYAAASLKPVMAPLSGTARRTDFRGFMPRPH